MSEQPPREYLISHALYRAKERFGFLLTEADIEQLSKQYGTLALRVVPEAQKSAEEAATRPICYSARFGCYVVYDVAQKVVVTFLPMEYQLGKPLEVVESATTPCFVSNKPVSTLRFSHDRKVRKLAPQKAPAKPFRPPWYFRNYITVPNSPVNIRKQWRCYLTTWYCEQEQIPIFFEFVEPGQRGTVKAKIVLPNGVYQSFEEYYVQNKTAIWERITDLWEESLPESPEEMPLAA